MIELVNLNFLSVVAVTCDNSEAMGKEKCHKTKLPKSTKNNNIKFRKKTITKWKSDFKLIKSYHVSSYYGKNWRVITIMKVSV